MSISPSLDLDPDFEDFNFCATVDPALVPGRGPTSAFLYEMVCRARKGERASADEFADTIYWTLQEGSFEAFKWKHGPRPISYEDWFFAKIVQLLEILLYDTLLVDHGDPPKTEEPWKEGDLTGDGPIPSEPRLRRAFKTGDLEHFDWWSLVRRVCKAGPKRLKVFDSVIEHQIKLKATEPPEAHNVPEESTLSAPPPRQRLSRNDERNMLIISLRRRGTEPEDICRMLDRRGFDTTPGMQKCDVDTWVLAWNDPEFHKNVQQLFAKAARRFRDVKS